MKNKMIALFTACCMICGAFSLNAVNSNTADNTVNASAADSTQIEKRYGTYRMSSYNSSDLKFSVKNISWINYSGDYLDDIDWSKHTDVSSTSGIYVYDKGDDIEISYAHNYYSKESVTIYFEDMEVTINVSFTVVTSMPPTTTTTARPTTTTTATTSRPITYTYTETVVPMTYTHTVTTMRTTERTTTAYATYTYPVTTTSTTRTTEIPTTYTYPVTTTQILSYPMAEIRFDYNTVRMNVGDDVKVSVYRSYGTSVYYNIYNPDIATISDSGSYVTIHALKAGETTLWGYCSSDDNGTLDEDSVIIIVEQATTIPVTTIRTTTTTTATSTTTTPVSSLQIIPSAVSMNTGDTNKLAVVGAANLSDVVWTSEDTSVATVSDNGTVTAKGSGSTLIYAVYNGNVASCKVTVKADKSVVLGDANGDGSINMSDATAIIQSIGNKSKYALDSKGLANADTNGDGQITTTDAIIIQRILAGEIKITDLPVKDN